MLSDVGIIDPCIARFPTRVNFSVGVVVPIPSLPFALSKNNAELFSVRSPLAPMNGTDPGVNDV